MSMSDFEYTLQEGKPQSVNQLERNSLNKCFTANIPDEFMDFYANYGEASIWSSAFFIVAPSRFDEFLPEIFGSNEPDFPIDKTVITGYSIFGKLYGYTKSFGDFQVDIERRLVHCTGLVNNVLPGKMQAIVDQQSKKYQNRIQKKLENASLLLPFDRDDIDVRDFAGQKMLSICAKQVGKPKLGEVIAFAPFPGLSEEPSSMRRIENASVQPLSDYLRFALQMGKFALARNVCGVPEIIKVFEK